MGGAVQVRTVSQLSCPACKEHKLWQAHAVVVNGPTVILRGKSGTPSAVPAYCEACMAVRLAPGASVDWG